MLRVAFVTVDFTGSVLDQHLIFKPLQKTIAACSKSPQCTEKLINSTTFAGDMVKLLRWNNNYLAYITAGGVPEMETILNARPKSPRHLQDPERIDRSKDEALAWTLSALGRRGAYLWRRRYPQETPELELPLRTWVLQPSGNGTGKLDDWFKRSGIDKNYRVVLHGMPIRYDRQDVPEVWGPMYERNRLLVNPTPGRLNSGLRDLSEHFLLQMCDAYEPSSDALDAVIDLCGHPYETSDGMPTGYRR